MSGTVVVEDKHWPLVVVVFDGTPTPEAFAGFLAKMESLLRRGQRHAYLLDGRRGSMLGTTELRLLTDWLKRLKTELKTQSAGTALVVDSAAVRFVLSAVYLVQPPVAPTESFQTVGEAYAWLTQRMREEKLPLVPRVELGL